MSAWLLDSELSTCRRLTMEQFVLRSCIRGYYIYKDAWTSSIGETLDCECEAANHHDPYYR